MINQFRGYKMKTKEIYQLFFTYSQMWTGVPTSPNIAT